MKRRFGVLGLALAAGALISEHWATTLTPLIASQGVVIIAPPLEVVVHTVLLLLPPVLLLFSGPSYAGKLSRVIGSLLFALLSFTFLLEYFAAVMQFDQVGALIAVTVEKYKSIIIVVGLAAAIADVFVTRTPKRSRAKHAEH